MRGREREQRRFTVSRGDDDVCGVLVYMLCTKFFFFFQGWCVYVWEVERGRFMERDRKRRRVRLSRFR